MKERLRQACGLLVVAACILWSAGAGGQDRDLPARRSQPSVTLPADVELREGIVYGVGGERELKLDLFLPKEDAAAARPAVVFMHGGGWRGGNPGQFRPQSIHLAGVGYVCACIQYRLSDEAKFPAALEDCKCAVRWLRANAGDLGVDPDRIAVAGGSAGAHLAAMVAMTGAGSFEGEGGHADQSSAANLAVCFNPPTDLTAMAEGGKAEAIVAGFLGKAYADDPELYGQASPVTHVDPGDPPLLALHGTADETVPYAQAEALVERLKEAGVEAELFTAEGAGHGFFNRPPWYEPTLRALEAFLDRHFRPDAPGGGPD